jgi:hypothetical protein
MREYIITFDRINSRMGFYNKGSSTNGGSNNSNGNGTSGAVFDTFDPLYFVISQYLLGVFSVIAAIIGLTLWTFTKRLLEDKA